jgi:WD40 repeat protein/predicted Ser/Thr protein kinase
MSERDDRLQSILVAYIEAVEAGHAPSRDELLARHPEFAAELAEFLDGRERIERAAAPLHPAVPSPAAEVTVVSGEARTAAPLGKVRYFGDYELLEEIARGGMGIVYKGRQVSLDRIVALKMILAGQLASADDVRRFRQEANAAANLDHPNIVPIYEVGEHEGQHYFSMKFIDGGSLAGLVGGTQRRAAELLGQVARAVHHAHQRGILHRDLKPANILIDGKGQPHVTDFGLARRVEGDQRQTQTGAVVGTPSYMSPEQASGRRDLTTAVDVYSLGAILYELLTGQPPFRGPTPLDTLMQVMEREPPRPRSVKAAVDRDLETVCLKCLEKEPSRRYGSAEALAEDLDRWLAGDPISARPVGKIERLWRWCKRNPVVAGLAASLLLVLLTVSIGASIAAVRFRHLADSERAARQQAQDAADASRRRLVRRYVTEGTRHLEQADLLAALPWLVEALALEEGEQSNEEIHRIRVGALLRQCPRLTRAFLAEVPVTSATLSSDGRRLFTEHQGQATAIGQVWDVASGQVICRLDSSMYPTNVLQQFSSDGRRISGVGDRGPSIWDTTTGKRLVSVPLTKDESWHAVHLSSDGRRLLTISKPLIFLNPHEDYYGRGEVRVWNAADGTPLWPAVRPTGCSVEQVQFSPDGSSFVTAAVVDSLEKVRGQPEPGVRLWNTATGKPIGPPLQGDASLQDLPFSPDGRLLLTVGDKKVYLWDTRTGKQAGRSLDHEGKVFKALFHPGGERVLTLAVDGYVRLWDSGKGEVVQSLVRLPDPENQVLRLSPDGLHLLARSAGGNLQLWDLFRRDGNLAGPSTPLWPGSQSAVGPPFTPDSRHLLTVNPSGVILWDLAIGSHWPEEGGAAHWSEPISPDGRFQLRTENKPTTFSVRVHDARTGAALSPPREYAGVLQQRGLVFSPDSRQFMVAAPLAGQKVEQRGLVICDCASGRVLHALQCGAKMNFELSPDFRYLATFPQRWGEAGAPDEVTIQQVQTGRTIRLPRRYEAGGSIVFSPDSEKIALLVHGGDKGNTIWVRTELWDLASGGLLWEAPAPMPFAGSTVFSPDGSRLALAGARLGFGQQPQTVCQVWDVGTGQPIGPLMQGSEFSEVDFLPDVRRLLVQSHFAHQARVWDAVSGKPLTPPWNISRRVFHKPEAVSQDGRLFFSDVAPLRLWDLGTGELVASAAMQLNPQADYAPRLSPDARQGIVEVFPVGGEAHRIVWPLEPDRRPLAQLRLLANVLSGSRIDDTGAFVPLEPDEFRSAWQELQSRYPESATVPPRELQAWKDRQTLLRREAAELLQARP